MWKIAASLGAVGLVLCMAGPAESAKPGKGRGGASHVTHAATHISVRGAATHITHVPRYAVRAARRPIRPRVHVPTAKIVKPAVTMPVAAATAAGLAKVKTDPKNFAARRQFAANDALRSFHQQAQHWLHHHHHLGWIGPLFWPYAYGDFFYCALWPYDYCFFDPFWLYGYDDLYEGIFFPYVYDQYVQGPGAPARMTALTQGMTQACANEAAEVTGWPIDQIQQVVQPNDQQRALLDELGNAIVKAGEAIKSQCPTRVSFTPTGRLADMQQRLQGMIQAVDIVSPPLARFYDSLSDEQKARFDQMRAPGSGEGAQNPQAASPKAECGGNVLAWPADKIEHVVQPTAAQRAKLDVLQSAAAQAADIIKAACPSEEARTPPGRLAAFGQRLHALLQAVQTVQPPLQDFYDSLSDDQKARFNTLGRQIVAEQ